MLIRSDDRRYGRESAFTISLLVIQEDDIFISDGQEGGGGIPFQDLPWTIGLGECKTIAKCCSNSREIMLCRVKYLPHCRRVGCSRERLDHSARDGIWRVRKVQIVI
jgi:hypothetical protein